MYGKD